MVKGISRIDETRRTVEAGVTAISVSNHGGNNLDTVPATVRIPPSIADAVGRDVEVLLDGGIRRDSDVVKALALCARAVMIGRACRALRADAVPAPMVVRVDAVIDVVAVSSWPVCTKHRSMRSASAIGCVLLVTLTSPCRKWTSRSRSRTSPR